jgi:hypothetical protein
LKLLQLKEEELVTKNRMKGKTERNKKHLVFKSSYFIPPHIQNPASQNGFVKQLPRQIL